jgi:hypothetical protein
MAAYWCILRYLSRPPSKRSFRAPGQIDQGSPRTGFAQEPETWLTTGSPGRSKNIVSLGSYFPKMLNHFFRNFFQPTQELIALYAYDLGRNSTKSAPYFGRFSGSFIARRAPDRQVCFAQLLWQPGQKNYAAGKMRYQKGWFLR